MRIYLLKEAALDLLVKDIDINYDKYKENKSWLKDYYYNNNVLQYSFDSGIEIDDVQLAIGTEETDLQNIKIVYEAFKDRINTLQATDLRLWAYLTHGPFWEYMRVRWPLEQYDKKSRITNRYFFDRARYVRNGLSRLYWTGLMTYDPDNDDHYEYTDFVLSDQDTMVASLERQIGRSKNLILGNLQALKEAKSNPEGFDRDDIRDFFVRLNQLGGVSLLDSYSREEALDVSCEIVSVIHSLPRIEDGKNVTVRFKDSGKTMKYKVIDGRLFFGNVLQKTEPMNVIGKKTGRGLKINSNDAVILGID